MLVSFFCKLRFLKLCTENNENLSKFKQKQRRHASLFNIFFVHIHKAMKILFSLFIFQQKYLFFIYLSVTFKNVQDFSNKSLTPIAQAMIYGSKLYTLTKVLEAVNV